MPVIDPDYNREGWLTELARLVEPFYKVFKLEPYRLTCGWPSRFALGKKSRRIGECHSHRSSKGGLFEIFISPVLDNPLDVAGTVCHEIAHVAAGIEAQHKGRFVEVCKHVGLTKGKPTEASPGKHLAERLNRIISKLGPYPHKALVPAFKVAKTSSSFTLVCAACGCRVSISAKWLREAGPTTCACGGKMVLKDELEED
jgi:hypothetical protein